MNILINASCKIGGGIQVCDSLIRTLNAFPKHSFVVCASDKVMESLRDFPLSANIQLLPYPMPSQTLRLLGKNPALDRIVSKNKIDAVFTVFGPSYWRPQIPHLCGFAILHYVYPESEFLQRLSVKKKIRLFLLKMFQMGSFKKHSDALVSENPEVTQRLIQMYKVKNAYTVYNTCHPVFTHREAWDCSIKLPFFEGTTLLTVASYYPHKNLEIMVPAARFLQTKYPDFKFRFVLSIERKQLQTDLSDVEEHFFFLGKVSIFQCPYLYQQSQIMLLPTLLECFSAAWAEAMITKVPILTSDLPFAHGICENAAMFVDPFSPEKIAESIYQLATSPDVRKKLIENGDKVRKKFVDSHHRMQQYLDILQNIKKD